MPEPAKPATPAKSRPFLKWAGGKYRLTDEINRLLPKRKQCLVEPFVGAGAVFLNSNFKRYILADINPDLINLFNIVKLDVERYIQACKPIFFHLEANTEIYYYGKRKEFNQSTDVFQRAILFLYLNRFGFNGLCRYNSKNEFNVPFGDYKTHYFPEEELRFFAAKAQSAVFICADFQQTFKMADENSVIYCDPPYAPLSQDSNFTNYAGNEFSIAHQRDLANLAKHTMEQRNIQVLISNHDTPFTREIYQGAKIRRLKVQRFISQAPHKRIKVRELIAMFKQGK
ncbi:DNA-adenine methyltransferase [Aggregatibacter actinomycetemcomitans serotype e str. SC1083]|uniref:Site-specific DNA-methyltransferase (adenine-specific) n=1 Tax=Aggregatibacter actinomycetemcomitans serotype e str. SC1083 TaxID=907488 RepID=G4A5J6_AGGAC|nr:Dam family site-specific DNA-(adenine-N6)-methyltransferase [Aggregatibacter actinomycetemcomitans]EGY35386.1 DNA-adenine methyltransferase [Aggregatibacter actinomycetemcomitans serotype e str. SC1083]KYK76202.1 DNA adenine methylase [Aggregatibacter actinomycetemcomitans serotype e str. SA3096]KYK79257.1 DNA adenine methylase [Aggregatibacter actinomycetemcomitans serotype e str. SC936]KYK94225.1 DNA adenine methylase [Aggregatibacter actinomycetemcomitans serotype e str. ANH9776]TYB21024